MDVALLNYKDACSFLPGVPQRLWVMAWHFPLCVHTPQTGPDSQAVGPNQKPGTASLGATQKPTMEAAWQGPKYQLKVW